MLAEGTGSFLDTSVVSVSMLSIYNSALLSINNLPIDDEFAFISILLVPVTTVSLIVGIPTSFIP